MNREEIIRDFEGKLGVSCDFAYVLAYYFDCAQVGKYQNHKIVFRDEVNDSFLQKMIIFNSSMQYQIYYDEDKQLYESEIIQDDALLNHHDYYDEFFYVTGNQLKVENDWYVLEQNGRKISLPKDYLHLNQKNIANGVKLQVRNYFSIDSSSSDGDDITFDQILVLKHRLVNFVVQEGM